MEKQLKESIQINEVSNGYSVTNFDAKFNNPYKTLAVFNNINDLNKWIVEYFSNNMIETE